MTTHSAEHSHMQRAQLCAMSSTALHIPAHSCMHAAANADPHAPLLRSHTHHHTHSHTHHHFWPFNGCQQVKLEGLCGQQAVLQGAGWLGPHKLRTLGHRGRHWMGKERWGRPLGRRVRADTCAAVSDRAEISQTARPMG